MLRAARNAPRSVSTSSPPQPAPTLRRSPSTHAGRRAAVCAVVLAATDSHTRRNDCLAHRVCPPPLRRAACHDMTAVLDPEAILTAEAFASVASVAIVAEADQPEPGPAACPSTPRRGHPGGPPAAAAGRRCHATTQPAPFEPPTPHTRSSMPRDASSAGSSPPVPAAMLERLATDDSPVVRAIVGSCPATPRHLIALLAADDAVEVRSEIAASAATPARDAPTTRGRQRRSRAEHGRSQPRCSCGDTGRPRQRRARRGPRHRHAAPEHTATSGPPAPARHRRAEPAQRLATENAGLPPP